ncbi:right-handed parallel beta-helix repeat-containing protein [Tundrisphaera sp. TA3]|uniref:right-handed parallel beta-helix repeat-containing protein n=1 Tax=Tundrisphaera sp. TA3 TaxID=3435775 RepID=UPI003EB6CEAE
MAAWSAVATTAQAGNGEISAGDYPTIQAAIDANPGRVVAVPPGDHAIGKTIRIDKPGGGLAGSGRIVMSDPGAAIVEIEHARGVRLSGLTLTRAEGAMETGREGVLISDGRDITLDGLRVEDNRTRSGAIRVEGSHRVRISRCEVRNYMSIAVDDRTRDAANQGYAFRCIDGTGIVVDRSHGTLIEGCTIIEERLIPTPELKAEHRLGTFTAKNPTKGALVAQATWDAGYVNNWHQGSALIVTGPTESADTRILGNHIENAAQGIDLHSDRVVVSNNIVTNSFIGMKAMHGSRHVLITGNQFSRNDLWAIGLMPGVASAPGNVDGGSIIANNIISGFGAGHSAWIWKDADRCPIRFDHGQEPADPPLRDVIVTGNIVDDGRRDRAEGEPDRPRYRLAVRVEAGSGHSPEGLHFSDNLFHPGTEGISNVELKP